MSRWQRAIGLATAASLALIAVDADIGWTPDDAAPPEPLAASAAPGENDVDTRPAATVPARAAQAARPIVSAPTLTLTRHGSEWRIEATGVSRLAAAQRLAQASGSRLSGDLAQLAAARPLQLAWQGRSAASAWQAVLGQEVSFATSCDAARCRVWIIDANAPLAGATPALQALPGAAPATTVPALAVEVAAAAPQADSPDPRTAAHHD